MDVDYRFRVAQVGDYGRTSDGGIYAESPFGKVMEAETALPGSSELGEMPYVNDGGSSLSPHYLLCEAISRQRSAQREGNIMLQIIKAMDGCKM